MSANEPTEEELLEELKRAGTGLWWALGDEHLERENIGILCRMITLCHQLLTYYDADNGEGEG